MNFAFFGRYPNGFVDAAGHERGWYTSPYRKHYLANTTHSWIPRSDLHPRQAVYSMMFPSAEFIITHHPSLVSGANPTTLLFSTHPVHSTTLTNHHHSNPTHKLHLPTFPSVVTYRPTDLPTHQRT